MKVPVYLEKTLELIGVVDVDPSQLATLQRRHCYRMANMAPMARIIAYDPTALISDSEVEAQIVEFRYFPLTNSHGATTIALTVRKREWLGVWPRQLWPRRRKERLVRPRRRHRLPYSDPRRSFE